jgi:hypothetical protein
VRFQWNWVAGSSCILLYIPQVNSFLRTVEFALTENFRLTATFIPLLRVWPKKVRNLIAKGR